MAAWKPTEPEPTWLASDRRPEGVDDDTVAAVGKLGEAQEWLERARGRLYDFHQMSSTRRSGRRSPTSSGSCWAAGTTCTSRR